MKDVISAQNTKFIVTALLLGLNLFTLLVLETYLTSYYAIQLVFIFIAGILTSGALFGLWIEEPWSYPLSTIIFSASLLNLLWLFIETEAFLTFAFGLLVSVSGVVTGLVKTEEDDWHSLETYELPAQKKRKRK